jgi:hypothetical protein
LSGEESEVPDRWHSLFYVAAEGAPTAEQFEMVSGALRNSPEARRLWFEIHDLECGLRELLLVSN